MGRMTMQAFSRAYHANLGLWLRLVLRMGKSVLVDGFESFVRRLRVLTALQKLHCHKPFHELYSKKYSDIDRSLDDDMAYQKEIVMFSNIFSQMRNVKVVSALVACFLLVNIMGCQSRYSGSSYSGRETRQAQTVQWGTVEAIDYVTIDEKNSGLGVVGGAVAGGALGSLVGRGSGHVVGTVIGSLAGAAIGYGVEDAATTEQALEYTIMLESGRRIAVVQTADSKSAPIYVGDHVRIFTSPDGTVRVRP